MFYDRSTDRLESSATQFEGPEKKLEIILKHPLAGLRRNIDARWDGVVKASRAEILSRITTDHLAAYLLSESSLFVWEDRVLMITCGRTTLVKAIPAILDIVGRNNLALMFYEQKNFLFPQRQPSSFEKDMGQIPCRETGKSCRIGPRARDHINLFYTAPPRIICEQDATFQILMHDFDPEVSEIFCTPRPGDKMANLVGLDRLYPHMQKDSYQFDPYGYSLNGIVDNRYFTIHVTPQSQGSYASFESNVMEKNYADVIKTVTSIFRPGRFSAILTSSMDAPCLQLHATLSDPSIDYRVRDRFRYELDCGYAVSFFNFVRENHG